MWIVTIISDGMMKPNVIVRPIMLLIFSFDIVLMFVCYIYIICYRKYFVCKGEMFRVNVNCNVNRLCGMWRKMSNKTCETSEKWLGTV